MKPANSDVSTNPDIGLRPKPEMMMQVMSDDELKRIHAATLRVLAEVGVIFPSPKALDIFEDAGAEVDRGAKRVCIHGDLLMEALAKAPRSYVMGSRGGPERDLILGSGRTYCGTGGTGNAMMDARTGRKRPSTKIDVAECARICDYLSEVDFYWPVVDATDKPVETMALHEIEAAFNNTRKHVHIVSCVTEAAARYAAEMARVAAGGGDTLKARPPLSLLVCPISPLSQEKGSLEAGLVFAESGLPVGFAPMPSIGSTGPATIAGTLVTANAEILSALCMIQLAFPGAPVYYPCFSMTFNPHSGAAVTNLPEIALFSAAVSQLGHFYHLPVLSAFSGLDATDIWSWQSGLESCIGAMPYLLSGPDMCIGMGLMDSATAACLEKIMLDADIIRTLKTLVQGFRVNDETLALDDIRRIGPMGHFLETGRTLKNMRTLWRPGLRHQWSSQDDAYRPVPEVVTQKIASILRSHRPACLEKNVAAALADIVAAAEKSLVR